MGKFQNALHVFFACCGIKNTLILGQTLYYL